MKTKLIYSGGMDSTVLLYWLKEAGHDVSCVSFLYGQRHSKETNCAAQICSILNVKHDIIKLPKLRGSALVGDGVIPHGHYAEESMKMTVVPNRNMIMLAQATSLAIEDECDAIAYGCHAGDHAVYPDCRPEFVATMAAAISMCDWNHIQLITPFVSINKTEIARIAKRLSVPLDLTWTCYEGRELPCGLCGSCVERNEAINAI